MVDFGKLLGKEKLVRPTEPILIFGNLDKESGKEYPRPPQEAVLQEWFTRYRDQKDTIIKLHTGQGKTLIGLLILQSSLNEGKGPALYICPNTYLVSQTVEHARAFGIRTVQFDDSKPPSAFLNSDAILVTTCNKLLNGRSVFGVVGSHREPIHIGALVIDDAHKCMDIIRESFSVIVKRRTIDGDENPIYKDLWAMFEESLKRQAAGTASDLKDGADRLMAVPFWSWLDRHEDVVGVLSKYKELDELKFVWDLVKDRIDQTTCVFSGTRLEIVPRLLPLELIPSFAQAGRRIFLSATLNEDAFLVRELGIEPSSVTNPLSSGDVPYIGERLILLPSLVDQNLNRERIVSWVSGLASKHGDFGVVTIVPSFKRSEGWGNKGARVTTVQDLYRNIEDLKTNIKRKSAKSALILVNEYDGVDLPDSTCRILCLDSLPSFSTLMERYLQEMRPSSGVVRRQLAQRVEQGMGRAIRGSSDWCIVVVTGNDLTDFISERSKRAFLSNEAQMQIRIGEELVGELKTEGGQLTVIERLVNQSLGRDEQWKEYYKRKMSELEPDRPAQVQLDRAVLERQAETLFQQGLREKAIQTLQKLLERSDQSDRGWYLQLEAAYLYSVDKTKSMDTQLRAYTENSRLFRPEAGISYSKLVSTGTRAERIIEWIKKRESYNSLIMEVSATNDRLTFGAQAESFEEGLDELGRALGFSTQRPEKTTGRGPDNLWHIQGQMYWLIECKSEVASGRTEISKTETGQLNNSIGWFREQYAKDSVARPILIHRAKTLAKDAYLTEACWVMMEIMLRELKENILAFYGSLKAIPYDDLSTEVVDQKLKENHLDSNHLEKRYLERLVERKQNKP